ncbi:MAG TPA: hypothetical protein VN023_01280 [Methylovorus sp.]|jgi:hypothetical protein|nr:hypothetical protein [Methylovorus sp.]
MLLATSLQLAGCASLVAPNYSPSYESIDQLKKTQVIPLSVGTVLPTDPAAKVNSISLRASPLKAAQGTFAKYLEDAIISDLKEMGFYDSASTSRIDITIIKNDIDISGFSTGTGVLEADIKVNRNGAIVLEKRYTATTQFESSFAGAVAIPMGQSEYPNLVRVFLGKLYSDAAFINAIKK